MYGHTSAFVQNSRPDQLRYTYTYYTCINTFFCIYICMWVCICYACPSIMNGRQQMCVNYFEFSTSNRLIPSSRTEASRKQAH